jgi:signal transduction histidine kinase
MIRDRDKSLHKQILRLRWVAPLAVLLLAAFHQVIVHLLLERSPQTWNNLLELAVYSVTGSVVVWLSLTWLGRALARHEQAQAELQAAHQHEQWIYQQLHAVHDIGCRVATAANMQEVLELAAHAPVHLSGAKGSAVVSFDETHNRLKLDMAWGLSEDYVRLLRQRVDEGISAVRCRDCTPLQAHVSGDCPLFQGLQTLARDEGIASLACLPITCQQKRKGIISAYFASPDGPLDEEVRLLNIVATGIAAAIEGVRLRAEQMATLYAMERATQDNQNLDTLLDGMLELTAGGWTVDVGAIFLYEAEEGTWHVHAHRGLGPDLSYPRYGLAVRLAEKAWKTGVPVIIPEVQANGDPATRETDGLASLVSIPFLAEGETLGALFLASVRPSTFEMHQEPLLSALARQMALIVRNTQLHSQLGHMAVLEERYRLSREMHDGLAQTISYLGWHLDHLEMLAEKGQWERLGTELVGAKRIVREIYLDVREAIDGLRLTIEHPGGLAAALQEYVTDFASRTGIATNFAGPTTWENLHPETEIQLLRVAQEALTNIRKHSGAHHAWLRLARDNGHLELVIADDGRGFELASSQDRRHLGLATMRERVERLGGTFTIATGPQQGTRITVTIPQSPDKEQERADA